MDLKKTGYPEETLEANKLANPQVLEKMFQLLSNNKFIKGTSNKQQILVIVILVAKRGKNIANLSLWNHLST